MGASSSVRADAIPGGAVLRTIVVRRFRDTPRYRIGSFVRFAVIWAFPYLEGRPGRTRRCSRPGGHSGFSRQDAQAGRPTAELGRYSVQIFPLPPNPTHSTRVPLPSLRVSTGCSFTQENGDIQDSVGKRAGCTASGGERR